MKILKVLDYIGAVAFVALLVVVPLLLLGCCSNMCSHVVSGQQTPVQWQWRGHNLYAYEDGSWKLICEDCKP